MGQFKVEKELRAVTLHMIDGAVLNGGIFFSMHSYSTGNPQTLRDVVEENIAFLPIKDGEGRFVLVGKEALACLSVAKEFDQTPDFVKKVSALVKIAGMEELDGTLVMPEGHAAFRPSDYLNSGEEWFRFECGGQAYLIARKALKEVRIS